jgi:hypothetical protein
MGLDRLSAAPSQAPFFIKVEQTIVIAERLAGLGLPVFPVRDDKIPTMVDWPRLAVDVVELVRPIWLRYCEPLIGVCSGQPSGIDVLDLDLAKHPEAVVWWEQNKDKLPRTRTHRSRSGGLHLLFYHQQNRRNSISKIHKGVDVKGTGGYFVWWPAAGFPVVDDAELTDWPDWLDPEPLPAEAPAIVPNGTISNRSRYRYGEGALDSACRNIMAAGHGIQETTINKEAFSIGSLVAAGGLAEGFALTALQWATQQIPSYDSARPWQREKLHAKVTRAFAAGLQCPRQGAHHG